MTRQRSWWPVWVGVGLLAALAILVYLRAKAPPEAARLLPESDAIVYAHLRPLRTLAHWETRPGGQVPVHRSREFQSFIDATGIVPERDLDSVAFALHRMTDPRGPNGAVAYSEVFTGRFDAGRLRRYLAGIAQASETYAGREVYSIPLEGRTLRVAVVAYDTVAASNAPTAEQIHSILDRSRASALWQPGSSLLAARFGEVPILSQAWGIGRIGLPFGTDGRVTIMGFELPVPVDTQLIASLRYSGSVRVRVEEIAPDALAAQHTADTVNGIVGVLRGIASSEPPHTPQQAAVRDVLSSVSTLQRNNRAVVTAAMNLQDAEALTSATEEMEHADPGSSGSAKPAAQFPRR